MARLVPSNLDNLMAAWLTKREPELAAWTRTAWKGMADRLTGSQVLDLIDEGAVTESLSTLWAADYEDWVTAHVAPRWQEAINASKQHLPKPIWQLLQQSSIERWVSERSSVLLSGLNEQQIDSINKLIKQFTAKTPVSSGSLAQILRPAMGFTAPQAEQLIKHWTKLDEVGADIDTALISTTRLASRLQSIRSMRLARTELAGAYNGGIDLAIKDAINAGAFEGEIKKVWRTQRDERVCPICGPLDGSSVDVDNNFSSGSFSGGIPPAHPQCRCVVLYEEG